MPVSTEEGEDSMSMNQSEEILRQCSAAIARRFLGRPDGRFVVGVGIGTKFIENVDTGVPCVRIYVSRKPKPENLSKTELVDFPGIETDIVDVGLPFRPRSRLPMEKPRERTTCQKANPGSSIGLRLEDASNLSEINSGTLGAVLEDADQKWYLLGCNHVLAMRGRVPVGTPVVAPATTDALDGIGRQVGRYLAMVPLRHAEPNEFDCALAEVTDKNLVDPVFPGKQKVTGFGAPNVGDRVRKFGKTTPNSAPVGKIVDVDAAVLVDYSFGTLRFVNQVIIDGENDQEFANDGDSGALLVNIETNEAVAMLFAPIGKFMVACPLVGARAGSAGAIEALETVVGKKLSLAGAAESPLQRQRQPARKKYSKTGVARQDLVQGVYS
jgi:hypothetical protein